MKVFCLALLEGSSLDKATKTTIVNIARNKGSDGKETRMIQLFQNKKLRKFTTNENQTTNIRFNQNHSRVLPWELEAKVKEEEEATDLLKNELVSEEHSLEMGH